MTALPEPKVLFGSLQWSAGTEAGARSVFQTLVTDLISVRHPAANEVELPGGGDWGIDTYVGQLDDSIATWQSKFFPDWKGEDQQGQVRDSFKQLLEKASAEGFTVSAWTLCVPCILPPKEQQWLDKWMARKKREHGIVMDAWNGVKIRRLLMQDDADWVRRNYFSSFTAGEQHGPETVQIAADVGVFHDALFVKQLEEAGHTENDAARGLFFAAEALARDLAARGDTEAVSALAELHLEIQALWETSFNAALAGATADGRLPNLLASVMNEAAACPDPHGLRLRPAHRKGIAHRLVENSRAGWVQRWRDIAREHRGTPASQAFAGLSASENTGTAVTP